MTTSRGRRGRRIARLALAAGAFLVGAAGASAQSGLPAHLGLSGGLGHGPTPSGFWGIYTTVGIVGPLELRAEYDRWSSGLGVACAQSIPESYTCDVRGWTLTAGAVLSLPLPFLVTPYIAAGGGLYSRWKVATANVRSLAWSAEAGARIRLGSYWSARVGARHLQVQDDDYQGFVGDPLRYTVGVVGLEVRLGP